ncbi:MAG TPA: hypothetical protein VIX90_17130, partial [Edaphobacter sp.]
TQADQTADVWPRQLRSAQASSTPKSLNTGSMRHRHFINELHQMCGRTQIAIKATTKLQTAIADMSNFILTTLLFRNWYHRARDPVWVANRRSV